jgi:gluconokinase
MGVVEHLVVMGVSGAGKSTVAAALAARLGRPMAEGDEFHPPSNVAAMAAGRPLTDADRAPWLAAIRAWITARDQAGESTVVTCSALRRAYRDRLREGPGRVRFVDLDVPRAELAERLAERRGHFMPASLLDSQLDTLEPLAPDEDGVVVAPAGSPEGTVAAVLAALGAQ